ncbi:hypothetical protein Clacol_004610 [Clathrus columnatus]|uniref:Phosphoglycerate mutase n=1 Tax=Clathrus columnatus TaxID=1419009 RepID=A0AAV5AAY5_9AGAM|nr:hypothetical protein Clacol_004610 [Clathrus columnatus]
MQDNDDPSIEQVLPQFGLVDTTPSRWENLKRRIFELNGAGAESSTTYRVLFIGRHGEGYHNRALETYGREAWTNRAIQTALISFEGIALASGNNAAVAPKAIIKEKLREANFLQHTCNMRRTRSFIKETYPQFEIEEGFTEEDIFWGDSETDDLLRTRVREGLDEIFEKDNSWYISITAHAVTNRAIREVLGAPAKRMPTGGAFAMVISVTPTSEQAEIGFSGTTSEVC